MLGNRRNLVFRVSIVINICVLLYAAMQLSGTQQGSGGEWAPLPLTADGEQRFLPSESAAGRNDTPPPAPDLTAHYDESTSQKTPSTAPTTNHTASSTPIAELDKKAPTSELTRTTREKGLFSVQDENYLTTNTLDELRTLLGCNDRDFLPQTMQRGVYWVLKNFVRAEHGPIQCHESITYTTHAGVEFLDNVQPLVERWMAPVSLAIHAPGSDLEPTVNSIRYLRDCLATDIVKQFVTFHVFFSFEHMPPHIPDPHSFLSTKYNCTGKPPYVVNTTNTYTKKKNLLYPINVARNIARDAAMTHFVIASDIELYPSPNLIPKFLNMIARNEKPLTNTNPRVFPLPIFEVAANVSVPTSKTELRGMLAKKTAIPFHKFLCPSCHNVPQSKEWMAAKETDQMNVFHVGKRRGKFMQWEPIFIGTHQDPYYDERLSWEGMRDKMPHGYVLCLHDFDFMILNNAFLIHKPGIKRIVKDTTRQKTQMKQSTFIKRRIAPEIKILFGSKSGCQL